MTAAKKTKSRKLTAAETKAMNAVKDERRAKALRNKNPKTPREVAAKKRSLTKPVKSTLTEVNTGPSNPSDLPPSSRLRLYRDEFKIRRLSPKVMPRTEKALSALLGIRAGTSRIKFMREIMVAKTVGKAIAAMKEKVGYSPGKFVMDFLINNKFIEVLDADGAPVAPRK